jgi:hypothetical protein
MQIGQFVDHRPSRSIVAALDYFGRQATPSITSANCLKIVVPLAQSGDFHTFFHTQVG